MAKLLQDGPLMLEQTTLGELNVAQNMTNKQSDWFKLDTLEDDLNMGACAS